MTFIEGLQAMADSSYMRSLACILLAALLAAVAVPPARVLAQAAPGIPIKKNATISGRVLDPSGKPIAGARVYLRGPSSGEETTDFQGNFTFAGVSFGTYAITVITKDYGTAARGNVLVNSDSTVTVRYSAPEKGLKTIAEVSTSGHASINVSAASIAAISPSDYAFQGQTSWHQILEQIPGVSVGGGLDVGASPSLFVPESPFFPAVVSINGTLPYETATLLDGMPLNLAASFGVGVGGGVDIAALPMNSFAAADIVRGPGADSPSIIDSVGGSFLLHVPGPVYKNSLEYSYSTDAYGGFNSNAKLQARFGRLSATVVYGVNDSPGPVNGTKIDVESAFDATSINGKPFWCPGGWYNYCLNFLGNKYTDYGSPPEQDHYLVPFLFCCANVSSAWSSHTGSVGLAYQLGPQVTAQVFYGGGTMHAWQFAPYYQTTFDPGSLGTSGGGSYHGSLPPGTSDYMDTYYDNFGNQAAGVLEEKITANLGSSVLRVAALQTYSYYVQDLGSTLTQGYYPAWGTVCYGTPPTSSSKGSCTPATFNGNDVYLQNDIPTYVVDDFSNGRDLDFSYSTQLATDVNFGLSYATSYYNDPITYGYPGTSYGVTSQPPSIANTTDETRAHVGYQPNDRLSADLSWYFAQSAFHVPDPADPFNAKHPAAPRSWADSIMRYNAPRLGAVYRAGNDVAIRAAAGGGYAVPPIYELLGTNGAISCANGICSQTLTNLNLQPEKSFGLDIGADARFHGNTVLSADVYRTNLYGQIFPSQRNNGVFEGQPLIVTEYQNLNESIMEGTNLSIRRDVPRGVYWNFALGLTRGYIPSLPASFYLLPGCKTPCTNTTLIPGINFTGGDAPGRVPYANGNASLGYRWSPWKFAELSSTYVGNQNSYFVKPFVALDLRAGYPVSNNLSILGTYENLTCQDCALYATYSQSTVMGIPTVKGTVPWEGYPVVYSPRSLLLTLNYHY
jgi:outer membrane receptor protein involved in Fe transport